MQSRLEPEERHIEARRAMVVDLSPTDGPGMLTQLLQASGLPAAGSSTLVRGTLLRGTTVDGGDGQWV